MPASGTVTRWARELPRFKAIYDRAKALGLKMGGGARSTQCPVVAQRAHYAARPTRPPDDDDKRWP